ncbi:hypothetical protein HYPSUDRAFT_204712 [Hypholoma sublateritium FD-334 SS-4]|uniref:Uncharacterized protein n=1 Tax=Hypholoma sublateritium (strain FD-334 SS-4) TaxID=945553 RepID=A0A0D2PGU4_HYPSF|nr:hypothetical protein HYPSUDRAFT_204708 [Hypholoma sublateritium FD-334 SS-4]KJA19315.1 hypothetical protein HYPSUDRAFT_204712 [Hypholoma sublateritium FD-334 SS-4]
MSPPQSGRVVVHIRPPLDATSMHGERPREESAHALLLAVASPAPVRVRMHQAQPPVLPARSADSVPKRPAHPHRRQPDARRPPARSGRVVSRHTAKKIRPYAGHGDAHARPCASRRGTSVRPSYTRDMRARILLSKPGSSMRYLHRAARPLVEHATGAWRDAEREARSSVRARTWLCTAPAALPMERRRLQRAREGRHTRRGSRWVFQIPRRRAARTERGWERRRGIF